MNQQFKKSEGVQREQECSTDYITVTIPNIYHILSEEKVKKEKIAQKKTPQKWSFLVYGKFFFIFFNGLKGIEMIQMHIIFVHLYEPLLN